MKKTLFLSSCLLFVLQSCVKEDVTIYQENENSVEVQELQAKSNEVPALILDDFNIESCSKRLGQPGGGGNLRRKRRRCIRYSRCW